MLFRTRNRFVLLSFLVCFALIASQLFAQGEVVYFSGPQNQVKKVIRFSFDRTDPGQVQIVVDENGTNFNGLAFRPDDEVLIVANATQPSKPGGLLICDPALPPGANCDEIFQFPDAVGVGLDPQENLYAVNDNPGGPDKLLLLRRDVACPTISTSCRPGGYRDSLDINISGVARLADVMVVPSTGNDSNFNQGDVVVLVREPGKILRFTCDFSSGISCTGPTPFFETLLSGFAPTGFAFAPNGDFLINTDNGVVLRVTRGGTQSEFDSFAGSGRHIAVGVQEFEDELENQVVFAIHNSGIIQRDRIGPGGAGVPNGSLTVDVNSPHGVVIATSSAAPTFAGTNVVNTFTGLTTTWTTVIDDGISIVKCTTEDDPRPGGVGVELALCVDGSNSICAANAGCDDSDCGLDLGIPARIPSFAGSFKDLGGTGTHVIRICEASTTATIQGVISDLADESVWLGSLPPCAPAVSDQDEPRFFYFPDPPQLQNGDFPYPEGDVFTDITDQCGVGGKAGRRSILAPGLLDTRSIDGDRDVANADCSDGADGVLECKLHALSELVADYRCIKGKVKKDLQKVIQAFEKGNDDCALEGMMDSFIAGVESASQSRNFSRSCDLSDAADLIARSQSANFMFRKLCSP